MGSNQRPFPTRLRDRKCHNRPLPTRVSIWRSLAVLYSVASITNEVGLLYANGLAAGEVSTFAGSGSEGIQNGAHSVASFYNPQGITIDNGGNFILIVSWSANELTLPSMISGVSGAEVEVCGWGNASHFLVFGCDIDKCEHVE